MRPLSPWPAFWRRAVLLGVVVLMMVVVTDRILLVLVLVLAVLLFWDLYNLRRLEHWLRLTHKLDPPRSSGLWGDIFDGLYRMRRRSRDRDKRRRGLVRSYRDSIRAMPDATVVMRADYRIDWCNNAARRLLGLQWPRDEGRVISNIVRHPEFVAFLAESQKQREPRLICLPSPADARLWLEIRLIPFAKRRSLLLARDTTALKRLETVRSDFVANVSHELRTPLTVIYGVTETLADELADHPELTRSLQLLQEQAERMKHLVDDLLLLSRLETAALPVEPEWIDVSNLLAGLLEEGRLLSGVRGHQFSLQAEPRLLLLGQESELRSAFANLMANAVNYTADQGQIELTWFAEAEGACVQVRDNGFGIAPEHVERLTERFYRVDSGRSKSRGGTGLGLAIVKHVLLRHEAHLQISSELGVGSVFSCHFPQHRTNRAALI